jgi:hypothetical protein
MDNPILFRVDNEPEVLASLAAALKRRFGADYRVVTDPSATSALERLERARGSSPSGNCRGDDPYGQIRRDGTHCCT